VSQILHKATVKPDKEVEPEDLLRSHMLTQFGQFVDHDVTLTPENDLAIDCCHSKVSGSLSLLQFIGTLNYCLRTMSACPFKSPMMTHSTPKPM